MSSMFEFQNCTNYYAALANKILHTYIDSILAFDQNLFLVLKIALIFLI